MGGILLGTYFFILFVLSLYGLHRYWILHLYRKHYKKAPPLETPAPPASWPTVTVQLPVFNEFYVMERLIDAVCALDHPRDRLEIQVLDDSTDDSVDLTRRKVLAKSAEGFRIRHLRRPHRRGFKAGALAHGLASATGEFVAIFDADFLPPPDFLKRALPHFQDPSLGLVQARWGHVNAGYSLLTRLQALFLDGHFLLEHTARNRSGAFFNFNGTAGVWRRRAIDGAGGWSDETLTEDLDISYRAQMKGWRFLFLPDLVCPAELPVDMGAFRSQQHRWTKGALQVAKKILPSLWRSRLPWLVKFESTVHLTANLGYLLTLAFALLLWPSLMVREALHWPRWTYAVDTAAFLSTLFSIGLFYTVVQKEIQGKTFHIRWRDLPALMAFGVGMCVNNSRAVLEALLNVRTDFLRTPKFNIQNREESWTHKRYRAARGWPGALEIAAAAYFGAAFWWCLHFNHPWPLPFVAIFLLGFSYVGVLTIAHARR